MSGRVDVELVRRAVEALPDAVTLSVAVRDQSGQAIDMRLLYMNAKARKGQPDPDAAVGGLCSELWPQMVHNGSFAACMRVLNTGMPEAGEFVWTEADTYRPGGYDYRAVRLGSDVLLWVLRDSTLQLRHAEALAALSSALLGAESVEDIVEVLMDAVVGLVGAAAGAVAVREPHDGRYTVRATRGGLTIGDSPAGFAPEDPYPMSRAVQRGCPLFFGSAHERNAAFPAAAGMLAQYEATAVLPLHVDEQVFGAVSLHFDQPRAFDAPAQRFMTALASQCALALERAEARSVAAIRGARLLALSEISEVLASSLDLSTTLENIASTVIPAIADGCVIHLRERSGAPQAVVVVHRDAAEQELLRQLLSDYPPRLDASAGVGAVVRTGEHELVTDASTAYPHIARSEAHHAAMTELSSRSWLTMPLRRDDSIIGALVLLAMDERRFRQDDVPFAEEVARRAAAAVANAQTHADQRTIARELQRSMLSEPPALPGLDIVVRYRPAAPHAEVGGDWYDAFLVPGGRLGIVIGDVAGHDLRAATTMGQLRSLLRGLACDGDHDPAAVLSRLDRINDHLALTPLTTIVLALVDLEDPRSLGVRYSSAGHLPPLVVSPNGTTRFLAGAQGPPVGVDEPGARRSQDVRLAPGDTLLLYTDGLIETRQGGLGERMQSLGETAGAHADVPLCEFSDRVLAAFDSGHADDDIATLAIRASSQVDERGS